MICREFVRRLVFCAVLACVASTTLRADALTPTVEEILVRVLERASNNAARTERISFDRKVTTEYLDEHGAVRKIVIKEYKFRPDAEPKMLLLTVDGKPARTEEDSTRRYDRRRTLELTKSLLDRYDFRLQTNEMVRGRPCFQLAFRHKEKLPVANPLDRVLNHLHGTIWIDCEEYELARLDVSLNGRATFWGGIVAAIERCRLKLERTRVTQGAWLQHHAWVELKGRKVLSSFHFRAWEDCAGFAPPER